MADGAGGDDGRAGVRAGAGSGGRLLALSVPYPFPAGVTGWNAYLTHADGAPGTEQLATGVPSSASLIVGDEPSQGAPGEPASDTATYVAGIVAAFDGVPEQIDPRSCPCFVNVIESGRFDYGAEDLARTDHTLSLYLAVQELPTGRSLAELEGLARPWVTAVRNAFAGSVRLADYVPAGATPTIAFTALQRYSLQPLRWAGTEYVALKFTLLVVEKEAVASGV